MSDENEFEQRFADREETAVELKNSLIVRVFGPYMGKCSYILKSATEKIREKENYDARICIEVPEIQPIEAMDKGPVYNLAASRECMFQADAAVFVLMESLPRRFDPDDPNEESEEGEDTDIRCPQDLNSSVIIELSEWISRSPRTDSCLVIYENGLEEDIGSLVRGLVMSGDITTRYIDTSTEQDATDQLYRAISGQCRTWTNRFEALLQTRID